MQVVLESHDGAVAIFPEGIQVVHLLRKPLIAEKFRVHANHQDLLIVRAIENPDPAALGKPASRAPEKIILLFLSTWLFETGDFTDLRIDARHYMADGPFL